MGTDVYYYQHFTGREMLSLIPEAGGRYKVMYGDEHLGSYHSAEAAADDVSGGHTFEPSDGVDFAAIGVPIDLGEWKKKLFMHIKPLRKA